MEVYKNNIKWKLPVINLNQRFVTCGIFQYTNFWAEWLDCFQWFITAVGGGRREDPISISRIHVIGIFFIFKMMGYVGHSSMVGGYLCAFLLDWFWIGSDPLLGFFRSSLWSRRIEDLELKTLEAGSFWVGLVWMCMGGLLPSWGCWLSFFLVLKFSGN